MKSLFVIFGLACSLTSFAQSFVLQDSGRLLTIDRQGNIYDLEQNVAPDSIKIKGKNWFITKQGITTISAEGLVYAKPEIMLPNIKESGDSWMIGSKNELLIVNMDGTVITHNVPMLERAKILVRGGNFLVIRGKDKVESMITIDTTAGQFYSANAQYFRDNQNLKLNISNIRHSGYNWMTDTNGTLFVVTAGGSLISKKGMATFLSVSNAGGNFFLDVRGGLQVVMDNGLLVLPYLPMDFGTLIKRGSNYGWNTRGDFFTFAESAGPNERNAGSDDSAMDRMLRSIIKLTIEQPDMRSVVK